MGARYDNIGGVQHKVSKRYDNIAGVWRPANKRFSNIAGVWRQGYTAGATVTSISSKLTSGDNNFHGEPTITRDSNGLHYTLNWSKGKYGSSDAYRYGYYETDITLDLGGIYSFADNSPGWNIKKQLIATYVGWEYQYDRGDLYFGGNGFSSSSTVQLVTKSDGTMTHYPGTINFRLTSQTAAFSTLTFSFVFTIKDSANSTGSGTVTFDIPNDAMSFLPSGAEEIPISFS